MLPECIEIKPLEQPVAARISVPGSKSVTNRALILAALAQGDVYLRGALGSEDTVVMQDSLGRLGFNISRSISGFKVRGLGGKIPNARTVEPLRIFVGNAGTAARFLTALLCLGNGVYRLEGVSRMHERPQGPLFRALRQLGYRIDAEGDHLPATIYGGGPREETCQIDAKESSQFASALLLCARSGGWKVELTQAAREEEAYVRMTQRMIDSFEELTSQNPFFQIEADASSASYFFGADWLLNHFPNTAGKKVEVINAPVTDWQIDAAFPKFLPLPATVSRQRDLADSIMTAIVLAPFAERPVTFTELDRLRVQECERVAALRTELTKCGAKVVEAGQTLTVHPSALHGAEIETYNDHRMAMCFAILGLKVGGIKLKNPACVRKTFPNFFQKLADPPPAGLGAVIVDCRDGRALSGARLRAE